MTEAEIELIVKTLYTQAFNLDISNFEFGVSNMKLFCKKYYEYVHAGKNEFVL